MAKSASTLVVAGIGLDFQSLAPLHRQLYDVLRQAILKGQLRSGSRLPSTRSLAVELGVSRNTVMTAFDQLLSEGCLEGKVGSGTYVARGLASVIVHRRATDDHGPRRAAKKRKLSRRGVIMARCLPCCPTLIPSVGSPAFRPGVPAFHEFPFKTWERLLVRRWQRPPREILCQRETPDFRPLQEEIAAYLRTARGVRCEPEQVVMVTGSQQALDLAARVLLDPGDAAWIEEPGYVGARNALLAAGAKLVQVPVDHEGLDVEQGLRRCPTARLVYVSPSHQYPLGVTLRMTRRLQLLDWASRANAWILEDDYDSEYRYVGWPLAALQGLDYDDRVIYLGTFSKVLLPAIRLGYMVVPPDLVNTFVAARLLVGRRPTIEQAVLADFIAEGHFARHIRRMRNLYAERQAVLVRAAQRELDGMLEVCPAEGGMHLVGWLPPGVDDRAASRLAAKHGVECPALSVHCLAKPKRGGLILGYGAFSERVISDGVRRLATALRELGRNFSQHTAPTVRKESCSRSEACT